MESKTLDSIAIEKLQNHSRKLFSLKHALKNYFSLIENMAEPCDIGVISTGTILFEYFETTKAEFDEVQKYLDILQ